MDKPKLLKGGFVYYESDSSQGHVIRFQYNPDLLQRTIAPVEGRSERKETINFTLVLDATDAMEHADLAAGSVGIQPALYALEMLVQSQETTGGFLADLWGRISGKNDSLALLVWGAQRVVPIRVIKLIVREEMFDTRLNPIRASVDVTLETLTDTYLQNNPRAKTFMDSYRSNKESLARQSMSVGSPQDLLKDSVT